MNIQFPVPPAGPTGQFLQNCFDVMRRARPKYAEFTSCSAFADMAGSSSTMRAI